MCSMQQISSFVAFTLSVTREFVARSGIRSTSPRAMSRRGIRRRRAARGLGLVVGCLPLAAYAQQQPPSGAAPPPQEQQTLTGDWGGLRTQLSNEGVDISSGFKGEFAGNVYGGPPSKSAESGEFDIGATVDTRKLFGLIGGTIQTTITIREGAPPPGGLLQQSEEVFGRGNIARLTEFWYRQKLFDDL